MEDIYEEVYIPKDRGHLIFLSFVLQGIGISTSWNMFYISEPYITYLKLGPQNYDDEMTYIILYLQYATVSAQATNMIFNWFNIFVQNRDTITVRIVYSISIQAIIIFLTVTLAVSDSRKWPGAFFWITIFCVIFLNIGNGIYQSTIFGMTAKFPMEYTGAVILGTNISCLIAGIIDILAKTVISSILLPAIYYLITALFILLMCIANYYALPLSKYYRYCQLKERRAIAKRNQRKTGCFKVPYCYIFMKALPQMINIFIVSFVTLSLFPSVQANVKLNDLNFWIPPRLYSSVTSFLTFSIASGAGCCLSVFGVWLTPRYLIIFVIAHTLFIPAFLLSNYHASNILSLRAAPILITNDWVYWVISFTMGVSSGYLSSLGMMYVSRSVKTKYASIACKFGAAALATGSFCGAFVSLSWPELIN